MHCFVEQGDGPPSPTPMRAPQAGGVLQHRAPNTTPPPRSTPTNDPVVGSMISPTSILVKKLNHELTAPLSTLTPLTSISGDSTSPIVATSSSTSSLVNIPRSYRIPDFLQRYFFATQDAQGKWSCASKAPPLVIVEVKPHPTQYDDENLFYLGAKVSRQTIEQAQYAFESSPAVQILGVLQAIGYRWRYIEYDRSKLPGLRSFSEEIDSSYGPIKFTDEDDIFSDHRNSVSPSDELRLFQARPDFIKPYFRGQGFLDLIKNYEESKNALRAIGEHIYNTIDERYEALRLAILTAC